MTCLASQSEDGSLDMKEGLDEQRLHSWEALSLSL